MHRNQTYCCHRSTVFPEWLPVSMKIVHEVYRSLKLVAAMQLARKQSGYLTMRPEPRSSLAKHSATQPPGTTPRLLSFIFLISHACIINRMYSY
jgi:hypothetical protein